MSYKRSDLRLKYAATHAQHQRYHLPAFQNQSIGKELNELYTPTVYVLAFARERARQPMLRACLSLLLKTFQRLGYFVICAEIPESRSLA